MGEILFFSVSDAMTQLARRLLTVSQREVCLVSGAKDTALAIAASHPDCNTYIARGGTAELLRSVPGKTVVELSTSLEEVLDTIGLLTAKGHERVGVVVPQGILNGLNKDFNFGAFKLMVRASRGIDLDALLTGLRGQGVNGVVVNGSTVKAAERMGFAVEILNNGASSIRQAVQRAQEIEKNATYERSRQRERMETIQGYSAKLSGSVDQAFAAVRTLAASSQELAAVCAKTSDTAQTAFQQVKETKEVLSLIKRIASQTSILGINGAIESARAGAQGKGFSVITHEIRQLANESNYAAGQIEKDLLALQKSMDDMRGHAKRCNEISQIQAKDNVNISGMLENLADSGQQMVGYMNNLQS